MVSSSLLHGIGKVSSAFSFLVKNLQNLAINCGLIRNYSESNIEFVKNILKMPKEPRKGSLKANVRVNRNKYRNEPASKISLQVIGTGANGTSKSLCVISDHQSYLFNCGEGTQRLLNEQRTKVNKTENIFITHKSWDNIGGLAGLTLTLQEMGVSHYTLHGPPIIERLFASMHSFITVAHVKINKHEYFDPPFEDAVFKIESIPIYSSRYLDIDENKIIKAYSVDEQSNSSRSRSPSPTQTSAKRQKLAPQLLDGRDVSIAYICKNHAAQGHLYVEKCADLGIPVGPLLGKLKKGEDITLPDGNVVKSSDVVSPTEPGVVFIVIECPTVDFLDSLLQSKEFEKYQIPDDSNPDNITELIVHFSPNDVLNHPKYKQWISRFPLKTQHLILNESCPGLANAAVYKLQHKLNVVSSEIFPLLKTDLILRSNLTDSKNTVLGEALMQYLIRPKLGFERSKIVHLEPEVYLNEVINVPDWENSYKIFKASLENSGIPSSTDIKYPQVTFLGTGSSIPSKARNVTCILLQINENNWMILDCGEGSYGQILRFFGSTETRNILKNLSAIFISHLHADHHTGLIKILHEREKALASEVNLVDRPLYLLAPYHINRWLTSYHEIFSPILNQFKLISNTDLGYSNRQLQLDKYLEMLLHLNLKEVSTVKVIHRAITFGVILIFKDDVKLVYSGDTMPCDNLVEAGKNCDLLIHEATMEDFLAEDAKNKTHSTTSQAIEIGQRMEAKFTMLTHFSQRYAKVPIFTDDFNNSVGVAFDNMIFSMNNVGLTSLFRPILKVIFSDEIEEMMDRRELRIKQKAVEKEREQNLEMHNQATVK